MSRKVVKKNNKFYKVKRSICQTWHLIPLGEGLAATKVNQTSLGYNIEVESIYIRANHQINLTL